MTIGNTSRAISAGTLVLALGLLSSHASARAPIAGEKDASLESHRLATDAQRILDAVANPISPAAKTRDAATAVDAFDAYETSSYFSFVALSDSPNMRTDGSDEVGRPNRIPANAPTLGAFGDLSFPRVAQSRTSVRPALEQSRDRFSFAVMSGDLDIYELLGGDAALADAPAAEGAGDASDAPALNYRGREVSPTTVPYFNDFESGDRGPEWDSQSNVTNLNAYTSFVGPLRKAEQTMHVRVTPGKLYMLQLDLYLVGFSENVPNDRSGLFSVQVDGAPVIEQTFGSLRDLSRETEDESETESEFPSNGHAVRELRAMFTATSEVLEIVVQGDTGPGFGTGSWGFDNVLLDEAPETNLGTFADSGFSGDTELVGTTLNEQRTQSRLLKNNPGVRRQPPLAPFEQSRGRRNTRTDFSSFFDDFFDDMDMDDMEPDEDMDDEMPDDDDEEEMTDEEIPSPGPAALLVIAGAAGLRRRR